MASWGQEADAQEQSVVSSLTDKVKDVSLSASGATRSGDAPKEPEAPCPQENGDEPSISPAETSLMQKIIRSRLVLSTHNVEVQRKDPNSPLYSVKTFEELKLYKTRICTTYTLCFIKSISLCSDAFRTILVPSGNGIIFLKEASGGEMTPQEVKPEVWRDMSLTMTETTAVLVTLGRPRVTKTAVVSVIVGCVFLHTSGFTSCGVMSPPEASYLLGDKITDQVILGTPGKIIDWAFKFKFFDIGRIKVFVLDEADIMIAQQGHHDQSIRLHKRLPPTCQMMLFSATYDKDVMDFAEMIISNPVVIRLRKEEESLANIKQYYVQCTSMEDKFNAISNIYGVLSIGQTIIFCHTRQTAVWLSGQMSKEGHAVALLSGELTVDQRIAVLDRFRKGMERVLITTNVCARGIDVEQVTVVVNFDLPVDMKGRADCETYLHRIGRTGRFGKSGLAVNMVDGSRSMAVLKQIEEHFGRPILKLDADDMDEIEKIQK
ncbi:unnamed protein product [Ixodes pacificus]